MIRFTSHNHQYTSIDPADKTEWISVSTLVHSCVPPFDAEAQSIKSSRNKKSKWYGIPPADIRKAWDDENKRSTDLGTWYHNRKEMELLMNDNKLQVYPCVMDGEDKLAPVQKLKDGIYPEHMVYLHSAGVCGQSDEVIVESGKYLDINDHKSNKEIRRYGYVGYEGEQMMLAPVSHLGDCEFWHYALQLSLYAYMIQRHNPSLQVRKLTINHVTFEEEGKNQYGYPIHKLTEYGEPIVKNVEPIELPYLSKECVALLEYAKKNRSKILKSKH